MADKAFPGKAWKELLDARERARATGALRMPNLIGVGAARCGTTTLFHLLRGTPGVFVPAVKELVYFSHKTRDVNPNGWTPEDYMLFFRDWQRDQPWAAEISPHYLQDPAVPERILAASPEARVVIQIRAPLPRILSHFRKHAPAHKITSLDTYVARGLAALRAGRVPENYAHPANNLRQSFYADGIARFLDAFGPGRVALIHLDHLERAPQATGAMLSALLGLPVTLESGLRMNTGKPVPGAGDLGREHRAELDALFAEDYARTLELYRSAPLTPLAHGAAPL